MKKSVLMTTAIFSMLLMVFAAASTAMAAVTIYTDETAFAQVLGAYYLEDFSNFSETGEEGPESIDMESSNGFSYTIKSSSWLYHSSSSLYYCDGAVAVYNDTDNLIVEFTGNSVTAFGGNFWLTDIDVNNQTDNVTVEISFADGSSYSYLIESATVDTFIGFTSSASISSFSVTYNSRDYYPTMDNLYVGSAVPVPAAVWLMGSGLLALAGIRRKKA